jgi:hypothetical protein
MQYVLSTFNFTADTILTKIVFTGLPSLNMPGGMQESDLLTGAVIDNVVLELSGGATEPPAVPEPASAGVLGGVMLLLLRRNRRRV